MKRDVYILIVPMLMSSAMAYTASIFEPKTKSVHQDSLEFSITRRMVLQTGLLGSIGFLNPKDSANAINIPEQKSYSSNARNMDRLSNGDSSAGSVYDNNPTSASARKRRAMTGCKFDSARKEVSKLENLGSDLSEKECNIRVMGGDTDFMLRSLSNLECPTCPYGIKGA